MAEVDVKLLQKGGTGGGNDEAAYSERLGQEQADARRNLEATANTVRLNQTMENQKQAQLGQQRLAAQVAASQTANVGQAGAANAGEDQESELESEQDEEAQAQALQEQQQQAALQQQQQQAGGLRGKIKSKVKGVQQAMQEVSASILKFAWTIMVESFGSAIIIVDFVVFLGLIMGNDAICKLGHEWIPKEVSKLRPTEAKAMGEKLGMIEKAGCCCLSGCWGLITMIILTITAATMKVIENPVSSFFEIGWEVIKNLFGAK